MARDGTVRGARGLLLLVSIAAMLIQGPAAAYFERVQAGPRGAALGGAYGAIADDGSALFWNPAALVTLQRPELLFQYSKPFVISNLQSGFVGAALPMDALSLGFYWHHTGVRDVMGEDLIAFGVARDLLPPGRSYALAVGASLKLAHVGFASQEDVDYGREVRITGDLSALLNLTPRLAVSYVVRNISEPTFDFVSGQGGTELRRTHDLGLAYRWHPASTYALSMRQTATGDWDLSTGVEVWFYDVFGLRTGLLEGEFSGGVGLKTKQYRFDMAFITHADLGISYEIALRVPFGAERW